MSQKRLLLIEDNSTLAMGLETFFLAHGYQVECAENGADALVFCQAELPDLVISDLMMRHMSGLTFLENLRLLPNADLLPVIVVTGHANQQVIDSIQALNITKLFPKPFDLNELLSAVQIALA